MCRYPAILDAIALEMRLVSKLLMLSKRDVPLCSDLHLIENDVNERETAAPGSEGAPNHHNIESVIQRKVWFTLRLRWWWPGEMYEFEFGLGAFDSKSDAGAAAQIHSTTM